MTYDELNIVTTQSVMVNNSQINQSSCARYDRWEEWFFPGEQALYQQSNFSPRS